MTRKFHLQGDTILINNDDCENKNFNDRKEMVIRKNDCMQSNGTVGKSIAVAFSPAVTYDTRLRESTIDTLPVSDREITNVDLSLYHTAIQTRSVASEKCMNGDREEVEVRGRVGSAGSRVAQALPTIGSPLCADVRTREANIQKTIDIEASKNYSKAIDIVDTGKSGHHCTSVLDACILDFKHDPSMNKNYKGQSKNKCTSILSPLIDTNNYAMSKIIGENISILNNDGSINSRVYLPIKIGSSGLSVLFDPGATKSCIRAVRRDWEDVLGIRVDFSHVARVSMATRTTSRVIGRVKLPIEIKSIIKSLEFFVVPELSHEMILGIDAWRMFGIGIDGATEQWWVAGVNNKFNIESRDFSLTANVSSIFEISTEQQKCLDELLRKMLPKITGRGTSYSRVVRCTDSPA